MLSAIVLLLAQFGQQPQLNPTPGGLTPVEQRMSLITAIRALEGQIDILSTDAGRKPLPLKEQSSSQENNVVALGDAMTDNLLLTRAYLALGVAELKAATSGDAATEYSADQRDAFLRHAEAIAIAIDARILEHADLRVYRSLQAGINQALRNEIAMASGRQVSGGCSSCVNPPNIAYTTQSPPCCAVVTKRCRFLKKMR